MVEELDIQAQIRDLTRHMDDLRVHSEALEDADKGTDPPMPGAAASGASAPGASGPAAGGPPPPSAADAPMADDAPTLMEAMAEPPVAWPMAAEPQLPAAADPSTAAEESERPGLGFSPPAPAGYSVDAPDAMAADDLLGQGQYCLVHPNIR